MVDFSILLEDPKFMEEKKPPFAPVEPPYRFPGRSSNDGDHKK
jgi:hypothetical protein